jgi:lysophospholipid acyltransferase (LPLAT)-like uncharacterized protein
MKNFIQSIICFLLFLYIRIVYLTSSWKFINSDKMLEKLKSGESVILAFWHGRLTLLPNFVPHPENTYVMVSKHGDGEFITKISGHFNFKFIRGSTNRPASDAKGAKNRGGFASLRQSIKALKSGKTVCITPDGPKGPRMRVSSAIIDLAKHTKTPIYPVAFSISRGKILSSWDRLLFPFPFSRGYFICGEVLTILPEAGNDDLEKGRKELENRLNTITQEVDKLAGIKKVEPAPNSKLT